jgi:hypothetical protein
MQPNRLFLSETTGDPSRDDEEQALEHLIIAARLLGVPRPDLQRWLEICFSVSNMARSGAIRALTN